MEPHSPYSLTDLEPRLRPLLPAQLYADTWVDPTVENLNKVFKHLRTLTYILGDYVPPPVKHNPPVPGILRSHWQEGTLLFTDLAGFTPLMEAHAFEGREGTDRVLRILNLYFSAMVEIISKSGGDLLEFTGDAILAQFLSRHPGEDTAQAVRAGLRMQRAMEQFQQIQTNQGSVTLQMRVGIHRGRFLSVDVGTPLRMGRVLMGQTVQQAKQAEGGGVVGRVCLTAAAIAPLPPDQFHTDPHGEYHLVVDDWGDDRLGEYEIGFRKRSATPLLVDRRLDTLLNGIKTLIDQVEPLATYQPEPVLRLLVEYAAKRQIPPTLCTANIMFVNLLGLSEWVDRASPGEETALLNSLSRLFALIEATIRSHGGVLHRMTYHLKGSDILIYFGVPNAHANDTLRIATAALTLRNQVRALPPVILQSQPLSLVCQIGIARGTVFAAEIGETRGRREYNILGDAVNTAARVMSYAKPDQIVLTAAVKQALQSEVQSFIQSPVFDWEFLGEVSLKGKGKPLALFALNGQEAS